MGKQDKFLFRGPVTTKKSSKLRSASGLSYTRAKEVVLDMLAAFGLYKSQDLLDERLKVSCHLGLAELVI